MLSAVPELVSENYVKIKRLAHKRCYYDTNIANEILSDAVFKMLKYQNHFRYSDDGESGFMKWAYRIVKTCYIDYYRKRSTQKRISELTSLDEMYDNIKCVAHDETKRIEYAELLNLVKMYLMKKNVQWFYVMDLRTQGYKCDEIAEMFGTSSATVRGTICRARSYLREKLADEMIN